MSIVKIRPAFLDCDHCIVFCADEGYMALTGVAIQSLVEASKPTEKLDILIIYSGNVDEHKAKFSHHWGNISNVSIRFYDASAYFERKKLYVENRKGFAREAYFRLIIPWILDPEYNTALYLDSDMIIRHSIERIFDIDLSGKLIGAVKDYWGICNCYIPNDPKRKYRIKIGLSDIDNYVISATILFNLSFWRKRFTIEQVIALCASKKWEQHDQDVLNVLCQGSVFFLMPTWGLMEDYGNNRFLPGYLLEELSEYESDPIIAHFGGLRKPYSHYMAAYQEEFWGAADRSPYMHEMLSKVTSYKQRNYIARLVNPSNIIKHSEDRKIVALYKDVDLGFIDQGYQRINDIRLGKKEFHIEGTITYFGIGQENTVHTALLLNQVSVLPEREYLLNVEILNGINIGITYGFVFSIPINRLGTENQLLLMAKLNDKETPVSEIEFGPYAALSGQFNRDYFTNNNLTIKTDKQRFYITKNTLFSNTRNELAFLWEQFTKNGIVGKKAVVLRTGARAALRFLHKPIWLVSDRLEKADDNGEVFFQYLNKYHKDAVHSFFILSKASSDYNRLKTVGRVVTPYSWKHKILALLAEWCISSQTDYVFRDPFRNYGAAYRNMLRKSRFVFMQHGVISNDLSRWLNKNIQELDGFVTSTQEEYNRIIKGNYHYTPEEVWLTGLPRFDRLADKKQKIITILPTWRKYLTINQNHESGEWNLKNGFEKTEYVRFYRQLMNSERLQKEVEKFGYKLQFKIHPCFLSHTADFKFNPEVTLVPPEKSYADIYGESSLLVTDYSSSIYDFIYLKKPIVYCQFDSDTFFSGAHTCDKGDFDYERDGFGEVNYNLEDIIDTIIRYMETGCTLHEPYKSRIEKAFPNRNANHCEMLYKMIKSKEK